MPVDLQHPANAPLITYFKRTFRAKTSQQAPDPAAYLSLGTHPEIIDRLWDQLALDLPEPCAWVLHGRPVLCRPDTGVVFAFGTGHVYALRVPPPENLAAFHAGAGRLHTFSDGSTLDLAVIGDAWLFGMWFRDEEAWCQAAYAAARIAN